MGTEILRPQISLVDRIRNSPAVFQRRRNSHRKSFARTAKTVAHGEIGTERVTILRRGDPFDPRKIRGKSPPASDGEIEARIVSDGDIYAGSATFVVSPSPSSLPFPSFSRKKKSQIVPIDDSATATRDLRRLLRLELC